MRPVTSSLLGALILAGCSKQAPIVAPNPTSQSAQASSGPVSSNSRSGSATGSGLDAERTRSTASLLAVLQQRIHFEFDKADLTSEDRALLDQKAAILSVNQSIRIRIDGNADERGSDEYNLVLGEKRAVAAKQYLAGLGVDPTRIEAISSGKERPLVSGSTEDAWAQNRRDEFVVTAHAERLVPPAR